MKLNLDYSFITKKEIDKNKSKIIKCHNYIHEKTGLGSDFLGWVNINNSNEELNRISNAAHKIRNNSDVLVVIGIGGSYLGARAVIEALSNSFGNKNVIFAGNNLSPDYLNDLLDFIKNKDLSLNVISKSGTTIEPAIAFKVLRDFMEDKYGVEECKNRIFVTTDKEKGVLKRIANEKGYETFVVPSDIGGRYSVFSPVGLLPIAASGINITRLLEGVNNAISKYSCNDDNDAYYYAMARFLLYKSGKKIELLANYEPKLNFIGEWWKQLFGESEGKDKKGIFPASVNFTTDLHSMGQYIQDGERHLFETVITANKPYRDLIINSKDSHIDELEFLDGMKLSDINKCAMKGTVLAHTKGSVPNIILELDDISEYSIGELLYFFEISCAMSGYLLGVNPFNQNGVEAYKKEMFNLLGKK